MLRRGTRYLTDMINAKRLEDGEIDAAPCFGVKGDLSARPTTLWIDTETNLVRRIDQSNTFKDFRTETTTTYWPVVGGDVTEAMLEFDPPRRD
jgi:hypothetical protein